MINPTSSFGISNSYIFVCSYSSSYSWSVQWNYKLVNTEGILDNYNPLFLYVTKIDNDKHLQTSNINIIRINHVHGS